MTGRWQGQVAVVTGGGGSIGAAIVDALGALGASVAAADLTPAEGFQSGERLRFDSIDVTDSAQVDAWIRDVAATWGVPTISIPCAGISKPSRLVETSDQDWHDVINVNLHGAYYTARASIREMLAANVRGRVVFVGSWAAHAPHPHIGAYSVSKAGLRALCQTLALDHAQQGILINEVAPGIVNAGMSRQLFDEDAELRSRTIAAIPSGVLMEPVSVARDVIHLASPDNQHTTGSTIISDGGIGLSSVMNPGRQ